MVSDIVKQVQEQLQSHLWANEPGSHTVLLAYLFGSSARADARTEADFDIAFLLDEGAYKADPMKAMSPAYLAATALGIFLRRDTDVTILNAASLEMAYEVVTTGRCIFERDSEKRLDYEVGIRGMYYDFKPFLDELRSRCLSNL